MIVFACFFYSPLSLEKNHSLQRNLSNLSSISDENSNLDKDSASEDGSDRCSPILHRKSPSVVDSLSSVDLSESEVAVHKNTVEVGIKKFMNLFKLLLLSLLVTMFPLLAFIRHLEMVLLCQSLLRLVDK